MKLLKCFILLINLYSAACDGNYNGHKRDVQNDPKVPTMVTAADGLGRPCLFTDINCIRRNLEENSLCNPTFETTSTLFMPHANLTVRKVNQLVFGLNKYEIKEFYINDRTRQIVFNVEYPAVTLYSDPMVFIFHFNRREPVITSDYLAITYKDISMTLTATIGHRNVLSHEHVYTYISTTLPEMDIGSKLAPKDPEALINYNLIFTDLFLSIREQFLTQGPEFMKMFLKNVICKHP